MACTNRIYIQLLDEFEIIHHDFTILRMPQTVIMFMPVDSLYVNRHSIHH